MLLHPDSATQFLDSLVINGASPNTVRAYKADLFGFISSEYNIKGLDLEISVAKYLSAGSLGWSINTLNRKVASFRCYGKWLGKTDFLSKYNTPPQPVGIAHPIPEGISGILKMIEVANTPIQKSLVALNGLLGLRISEVRTVRPSHINEARMEIKVLGKGNKIRVIPISDYAYQALLPRLIECWSTDELLVPRSDRAARRMYTVLGQKANLSQRVSTHDGRMTFGTTAYYKSGGDIRAVQKLLGHASMHTTENYTFVSMDAMRKASEIV